MKHVQSDHVLALLKKAYLPFLIKLLSDLLLLLQVLLLEGDQALLHLLLEIDALLLEQLDLRELPVGGLPGAWRLGWALGTATLAN